MTTQRSAPGDVTGSAMALASAWNTEPVAGEGTSSRGGSPCAPGPPAAPRGLTLHPHLACAIGTEVSRAQRRESQFPRFGKKGRPLPSLLLSKHFS